MAAGFSLIAWASFLARPAYAPAISSLEKSNGDYITSPESSLRTPSELAAIVKDLDEDMIKKYSYITDNFWDDPEDILLARLLLGEGEDCSEGEKVLILDTVTNRINDGEDWNGTTIKSVVLASKQYSAFNKDLNAKLKHPLDYNPKDFFEDLVIAQKFLTGGYKDYSQGATYYLRKDRLKKLPSWVDDMIEIGKINGSYHTFYIPKSLYKRQHKKAA